MGALFSRQQAAGWPSGQAFESTMALASPAQGPRGLGYTGAWQGWAGEAPQPTAL